MNLLKNFIFIPMVLLLSFKQAKHGQSTFSGTNTAFQYQGRTDVLKDGAGIIIGPASSVATNIVGDSCLVHIKSSGYVL